MQTEDNPQLEIIEQRWQDVDVEEARAVLAQLREPLHAIRIVSHSARPTAAASLVLCHEGLVFIKRYDRRVRDWATIEPYHRYVAYLADRGIPTPRFAEFDADTDTHPTVLITATSAYEVYLAAEGEDRYGQALTWDPPRTLGEAHSLGAFVGRLDSVSEGFADPRMQPNGMSNTFGLFATQDLPGSLSGWLEQRPSVKRYLQQTDRDLDHDASVVEPYASRVALPYRTLPTSWTHGDPHISNFMWRGAAPSAVIDFGLADRNTALFDLAMLLERHCIQWVDVMDGHVDACRPDIASELIAGYRQSRELSDVERLILPDVLAISQAEAGLNWLAYYMNGTGRMEDAAWCYDVCLKAHTRWFATPPGCKLLDAVRDAVD